jgi:FAD/FMN-containing dehydrogenase
MIEWSGAQRWFRSAAPADAVRAAAAQAGGHATLFRAGTLDKADLAVFTPLTPVLAGIERKLKAAFDPRGIFNPGRMHREF